MSTTQKVAYLKGLVDGLDFDKNSKESKVYSALIDALEQLANQVENITEEVSELEELINIIDEDLGDLEEDFYDVFDDEAEEDFYEEVCPECGCAFEVDDDMLYNCEGVCPECGEKIALSFDEDEEDEE